MQMYVEGHKEIVEEVVRERLPPGFMEGWGLALAKPTLVEGRRGLMRAIRRGLEYPDLPCGRVTLTSGNEIVFSHPRLCSVFSLVRLFTAASRRLGQYTEFMQSHVGPMAHLHSMAPVHGAPSSAVVREIVSHALVSALSFYRCFQTRGEEKKHAGFWLGILLHTLTDSYSPGHAVRSAGGRLVRAPAPDPAQLRTMRHAVLLYELAGRTLDAPFGDAGQLQRAIEGARRVKNRGFVRIRQQYATYLRFVSLRRTQREVKSLLRGSDRRNGNPPKENENAKANAYDVRAFSYYPTQPPLYHALRDVLRNVRGVPAMWDRMLDECADLFRIFKKGAELAAAGRPPGRFLRTVRSFLLERTFRLAPGAASRRAMNTA